MRNCKGYIGYFVDEQGNVFSHKKKVGCGKGCGRGTKVVIDKKYCKPLKSKLNKYGYLVVCISNGNGKGKEVHVHRLVAENFIPNPQNKPIVHHKDSNRANPCADNLMWVNKSENNHYAVLRGSIGGENCNLHKLSKKDVVAIRALAETRILRKDIAKMFGVTADYIRYIQRKLVWKYI